ncbi:unnamed protein product [Microthlaspi erraticum]|uniref:Uncharacterized protein n=1 Tax=Microthlaspi erraticum TaxID=1685480 RepID=A0A6D2K806_9BRAS|nr:unnamed protein product [Microthlaspi erraticum]
MQRIIEEDKTFFHVHNSRSISPLLTEEEHLRISYEPNHPIRSHQVAVIGTGAAGEGHSVVVFERKNLVKKKKIWIHSDNVESDPLSYNPTRLALSQLTFPRDSRVYGIQRFPVRDPNAEITKLLHSYWK